MESDMKTQLVKTSKMIKLQQTVERQLFSMLMNNTTNSDTHSHLWRYDFYWQKMEQIKNLFMITSLLGKRSSCTLQADILSFINYYKLHFAEVVALFLKSFSEYP